MRFAPCPPAFGLLLDLRKTHTPTQQLETVFIQRGRTNTARDQVDWVLCEARSRRRPKAGGHERSRVPSPPDQDV